MCIMIDNTRNMRFQYSRIVRTLAKDNARDQLLLGKRKRAYIMLMRMSLILSYYKLKNVYVNKVADTKA